MLRRAAILKRICDRRRAQNAQKNENVIFMHHQNRQKTLKQKII